MMKRGILLLWSFVRSTAVFLVVVILFMLILLLPREMAIEPKGGIKFTASYPFTLDLYQENVTAFIDHLQEEKGFGATPAGTPLTEHVQRYVQRSLKIVLPAFMIAMIFGTIIGMFLFMIRHKKHGRLLTFLSEMLASIPDFFLFISIQYILILAMHRGLPNFNLYNSDDWYSFIIPCLSLTLFPLFHMIRLTVATMDNESGEDYVQTAQAKGMTKWGVIKHVFWNAWETIINQAQMVMLYILSSLPIIEKLANYHGAGYQLLESILNNENILALLYFLPFLLLMYLIVIISQFARGRMVAKEVSEP